MALAATCVKKTCEIYKMDHFESWVKPYNFNNDEFRPFGLVQEITSDLFTSCESADLKKISKDKLLKFKEKIIVLRRRINDEHHQAYIDQDDDQDDIYLAWIDLVKISYLCDLQIHLLEEKKELACDSLSRLLQIKYPNDKIESAAIISSDLKDYMVNHIDNNLKLYQLIKRISTKEKWNDETPVYQSFFSEDTETERAIILAINDLCVNLCEQIAKNPFALKMIEWRTLERVIATALEGIGFDVELTPSSKDGGKDVIAKCFVNGVRHKYYIEIKHWISGKKVGQRDVSQFIEVNLRDNTNGGLFLSTSGYSKDVYTHLSEINSKRLSLGDNVKVVSICQSFVQDQGSALWKCKDVLTNVILEQNLH
jgi:restriction endonuclease Mrr